MRLFEYTISSPPSEDEFYAISKHLQSRLHDATGIVFETLHARVEHSAWITLRLRADSLIKNVMDLAFLGILSYSLRHEGPSVQSILLAFAGGKRLYIGRQSILKSEFKSDETGGHWERFEWSVDGYREWECDELPTRPPPPASEP